MFLALIKNTARSLITRLRAVFAFNRLSLMSMLCHAFRKEILSLFSRLATLFGNYPLMLVVFFATK